MGFLYLDESGNTGINDTTQSKLIFGGPYIPDTKRDALLADFTCLLDSYKCTIRNRIDLPSLANEKDLSDILYFLKYFEIHAVDIMNRKGLWSKLTFDEIVQFLSEVYNLLITHDITYYASVLDKPAFKSSSYNKNDEYICVLDNLLSQINKDLSSNNYAIIILEDGNVEEKLILRNCLNKPGLFISKELFIETSLDRPFIQIADAGAWLIQYYNKLLPTRNDSFATSVRNMYSIFSRKLNCITC